MKKSVLITIGIIVAVVLIIAGTISSSYNNLVNLQESVSSAMSTVDVQLKRRTDLIPNLVNTVKGFASHEADVINSVTTARSQMAGAKTVGEKAEADSALSGALSRLLVVVENYPDLKSNANFIQLSDELAGTENRISVARQDYNKLVKTYNSKIRQFPDNMLAGMFGFEKAEYFQVSEADKAAPVVNFDKK